MATAAAKRIALTRDQRGVLEAVYAIEKLPDSTLREKLSSYLNLSTRQIQVWFQNRRQRAKSGGGPSSAAQKKWAQLNSPQMIMDALFDFSPTYGTPARCHASAGLLRLPGFPTGTSPVLRTCHARALCLLQALSAFLRTCGAHPGVPLCCSLAASPPSLRDTHQTQIRGVVSWGDFYGSVIHTHRCGVRTNRLNCAV